MIMAVSMAFLVLMLFLMVPPSSGSIYEAESVYMDSGNKTQYLLQCGVSGSYIGIPVPSPPTCKEQFRSRREESRAAVVSLFSIPLGPKTLEVVFCQRTRYIATCSENFFGASWTEMKEKKEVVGRIECEDLVTSSPSESGTLSTKGSKPLFPCAWMTSAIKESVVTTFGKVLVTYDPHSLILHHGLDLPGGCSKPAGRCISRHSGSAAYWTLTGGKETCDLHPFLNGTAIISKFEGNSIITFSIPDHSLTISLNTENSTSLEHCTFNHHKIHVSLEGYLFSVITTNPEKDLKEVFSNNKKNWRSMTHPERLVNLYKLSSPLSLSEAKITYAYETLENKTVHELASLEDQICQSARDRWRTIWSLKEYDGEYAITEFLRDEEVTGWIEGGMMYVTKCKRIYQWHLSRMGMCFPKWKVISGNRHLGCISALENKISDCPSPCKTPKGSSFLIRWNSSHAIDILKDPINIIKTGQFFSLQNIQDSQLILRPDDMARESIKRSQQGVLSIMDNIKLRVSSLEGELRGPPSNDTIPSSSSGSPGFFYGLGLATGRITTFGTAAWGFVFFLPIGAGCLWATLLIAKCAIRTIKKKNAPADPPRTRTHTSQTSLTQGRRGARVAFPV